MIILPANTLSSGGYEVANSCRFESAYLNKSVTASSSTSWTLSFWIKIHSHSSSAEGYLWSCGSSSAGQGFYISTTSYLGYYGGSGYGSDSSVTNGVLRDPSAWYHVVFKVSSGTGTTYINGTQQTGTVSSVAPLNAHTGDEMTVNTYTADKAGYDDCKCSLAEYCFIDGTAYSASDFGEFDEDSPRIWKPIDVSGLTFGTNGYYLDFEDSANLGNDAGGGTDFSEVNLAATDQALDSPTNNWCTINPLNTFPSTPPVLAEGNLQCTTINADPGYFGGSGTIGVSQGKWYFEVKPTAITGSSGAAVFLIGVSYDPAEMARQGTTSAAQRTDTSALYYGHNGDKYGGDSTASYGNSYAVDDIVGVAFDLDNQKIYFSKNGTWQNSGDPTTGSTGTGSAFNLTTGKTYFPVLTDGGGEVVTYQLNFGSPPYTISSGNADGNGYGNFEYAVPSGYYSLCTKNLAEFG